MTLSAVSYSIAIAAASTLLFTLVLASTRLRNFLPRSRLLCADFINNAPAQRFRQRWRKLGRHRSLYLLPVLYFTLAFASLIVAEPTLPFSDQSRWLKIAMVALVALGLIGLTLRGLLLTLQRQRLRPEIDARMTVGHALNKIALNRNRTFHDVPTAFGVLDHVVAGLHGVFAICVIARRPARQGHIERRGDEIFFSDESPPVSVKNAQKLAARLAQECGKVLGHGMHVRLIVAVPGWEVHAQTGDDILVTNERHLNMLTGWKDQRDYLLDDDVNALHTCLDERCASRERPFS